MGSFMDNSEQCSCEIFARMSEILTSDLAREINTNLDNLLGRKRQTFDQFGIDENHFRDKLCASSIKNDVGDRFLVNIYQSGAVKNKPEIHHPNLSLSIIKQDDHNNNSNKGAKIEMSMSNFLLLKNERDQVCETITELSRILEILYKSPPNEAWMQKLEAEKLLLANEIRFNSLMTKIRDNYEYIKTGDIVKGAVKLSNFKFTLSNFESTATNFFVLILHDGSRVLSSKIVRAFNGFLNFNDEFRFEFNEAFEIKLQVFYMTLGGEQNAFNIRASLRRKKLHKPTYELLYRNIYTLEPISKRVFKSSFKLLGELKITPNNCIDSSFEMQLEPSSQLSLINPAYLKPQVDYFEITKYSEGFLTYGCKKLADTIIWNRRWCVLRGGFFQIYNSPFDQDFAQPLIVIRLKGCRVVRMKREVCPRTRCFAIEDENEEEIFIFRADSVDELVQWMNDVVSTIRALDIWKNCI